MTQQIRTRWVVFSMIFIVTVVTIHTVVVRMPGLELEDHKLSGRKYRATLEKLDAPLFAMERGSIFAIQAAKRLRKKQEDRENDGDQDKGKDDGADTRSAPLSDDTNRDIPDHGEEVEIASNEKIELVITDADQSQNKDPDASDDTAALSSDQNTDKQGRDGQDQATKDPPNKEDREDASKEEKEDAGKEDGEKKKRMNILLLYPDDWRHDTIGGVAPIVQTPFLNELARDGIRFTHNCVTTSICWISRATLFTGQYAARHKSYLLRAPVPFVGNFNTTWAGILRHQHNYHVGHMGKWQFWNEPGEAEALFSKAIFNGGAHWDGKRHDADITLENSLNFLDERPKDKPFAMTVAFYPPKAVGVSTEPGGQWFPKNDTMHLFVNDTIPPPRDDVEKSLKRLPWFFRDEGPARSRYIQRFSTPERYQGAMKNYYRLVYTIDKSCRVLVEKLKEQGIYEDTLIIFTTDNGLFHGEHGLAGKWYPFQESIRVPLIIRDPRMPKEKRNTLDDSFTLNIDLAETILGAAGVDPDPGMQGRDISDLYLKERATKVKEDPWRDEFYYEWTPVGEGKDFPISTALVRKNFKYMNWPQFEYEQLFDMINDPLEENDIAKNETYAQILKEMRERHNELREVVK